MTGTHAPAKDRLLRRAVYATSGCLEWTGCLTPDGYGQIKVAGRLTLTHRVSYEHFMGPVPDGLQLDHLCRNRACCNPLHLEAVTVRENVLRGVSPVAHRAAQTHCIHGHAFDEENTYLWRGTKRQCKTCKRARDRQRRAA